MEVALQTSLSFALIILIGILLKKKIKTNEELNGLKKLILTLALPATIFLALVNIKLDTSLLFLPLLALAFNLFLYLITPAFLKILGIEDPSKKAAAKLLIPSLAPGLSCFPFILEFLGDTYLAKAAMADLGNKFFVLFILYLLAVKWFYKNQNPDIKPSTRIRLKQLAMSMISEPINLFIVVALLFVMLGITTDLIPLFLRETLHRFSMLMTPLVLLFIGLAVNIKKHQFLQIFSLLMLRASVTLMLIGSLVTIFQINSESAILFYIAFALSACSFWPFAHISSIYNKEKKLKLTSSTFDLDFSLSILALSLPVSVLLIMGMLTAGDFFSKTQNIWLLSALLFGMGISYPFAKRLKKGFLVKQNIKST